MAPRPRHGNHARARPSHLAAIGLPVPARILQRKDGRDEIDLKIASLK